ncbi:PP2C family protein-serine/threonine phosphatase [Kitasatospora viridis]|uniref:Serine phosphatase RsbU (Regulator of sigma subunit) n=1 Tax=Kitasatospora viridis TaxID=281105 RepID=A0A561UPW4_9ACTN|nr:PP2C family protein-serine/threonine phosphatase [Kitasatospora viridis]TWG01374.1 serine phosphatase RsbU (regulator of sigma subunit) [Kitasatospora viridis]
MRTPSRRGPDGHRRAGSVGELTRWSPFLLIALAAVVDVATPGQQRFDRVLSAAPALAAATWNVPATAAFGVLAAAFEVLLSFRRVSELHPASFLTAMLVITAVTVAACFVSHVRQSRERELAEIHAVADTAQQVLLRPLPPRLSGVDLDLLYAAAAAQARIGGDFYEALRTGFGVRVIVGDVQGKGLAAVEAASVLLGSFREAAYEAPDLGSLVRRLETSMIRYAEQVPGSDASERFATAVLLELPAEEPVARLLNCGHPPPLLLGADGEVRPLEPSAPALPLNLSPLLDDDHPVDTVPFGPGDRLLLYTDGVSETRDPAGEFYPLVERVAGWSAGTSRRVLDLLRADLLSWGSHASDDVAVVIAGRPRPEPTPGAAGV